MYLRLLLLNIHLITVTQALSNRYDGYLCTFVVSVYMATSVADSTFSGSIDVMSFEVRRNSYYSAVGFMSSVTEAETQLDDREHHS